MLICAIAAGDVVNLMGYRTRPYEREHGATDAAIAECQRELMAAFERKGSIHRALWRCRRSFAQVKIDRARIKPKVVLTGEFWAMTTEGDGNYKLQRFLEAEGAEVEIELVTTWLLYLLWQNRWDTLCRLDLDAADGGRKGLAGKRPRRQLLKFRLAEVALRGLFRSYASTIGVPASAARLPCMNRLARLAEAHYDLHLRGGEGHLEVAKFLDTVHRRSAQMVLSVKPFGCMPSSGISDGVQSLVKARHPSVIFTTIETTGDSPVSAYNRIQMDLFKAHLMVRGG